MLAGGVALSIRSVVACCDGTDGLALSMRSAVAYCDGASLDVVELAVRLEVHESEPMEGAVLLPEEASKLAGVFNG